MFTASSKIQRNMAGWTCENPVEVNDGETFELARGVFLIADREEAKRNIGGPEMLRRAKEQGAASGIRHLEAMLREQDKIPVECRKRWFIATEVWSRKFQGHRLPMHCVYALRYDWQHEPHQWVLHEWYLNNEFRGDDLFVKPVKA